MTKTIPGAAQLRDDCSAAYQEALRQAKRDCEPGFFLSRGRWIRVTANGDSILDDGECEFRGTQKQLDAIVAEYVGKPGVTHVYIEGGLNWTSSLRDLRDYGDYEPWVGEWRVTIWDADEE